MADDEKPSKTDLVTVFKKLRAQAPNKLCFDCGAKNPTWATVTYGVFICIDCSAVHRSLGVHLTFVRSTTLDTNWTWLQLRAMQVGGNNNATQFFRQHGCTSTDAQQKYKSRAASLYRDKLHHLATAAIRMHGTKLHLDTVPSPAATTGGPDADDAFFAHHSSPDITRNVSDHSLGQGALFAKEDDGFGPSVDALDDDGGISVTAPKEVKKSTLGAKKAPAKKGLGAKKGKLGAQKVVANFAEIEQEAEALDKEREEKARSALFAAAEPKTKEDVAKLSSRLMVQDISGERDKEEERLKHSDPNKVAQVERLGMGVKAAKGGISHSLVSDMVTVKQEGSSSRVGNSARSSLTRDRETFRPPTPPADEDDWEVLSREPGSRRTGGLGEDLDDRKKEEDDFFASYSSGGSKSSTKGAASWDNYEDSSNRSSNRRGNAANANTESVSRGGVDAGEKLKQYAHAKAISSDQFFDKGADYETRANLAKFDGASAIGSADLWGNGSGKSGGGGGGYGASASAHMPDMADVKDSVRQGVSRVAGKLSNLSSSVSSYMSDNYGGY